MNFQVTYKYDFKGFNSTDTSDAVSSSSFPPAPPPPAPPLPPNGFFSSSKQQSDTTKPRQKRINTTAAAGTARSISPIQRTSGYENVTVQRPAGAAAEKSNKSSLIQTLTAQLNLAECLSAGGYRFSQRPRVLSSGGTSSTIDAGGQQPNSLTSLNSPQDVQQHQQQRTGVSPYRYGHHTSNFASNSATRSSSATTINTKRTVASQTGS